MRLSELLKPGDEVDGVSNETGAGRGYKPNQISASCPQRQAPSKLK